MPTPPNEPSPSWKKDFRASAIWTAERYFALLAKYHRLEVRHLENIPKGPSILVSNHNGGFNPIDGLFLVHYYRSFGDQDPIYVLAHDALFQFSFLRRALKSIGVRPASRAHASEILRAGNRLLIFPGGDYENMRPFSQRQKITWTKRQGFAKLALEHQVPIVPIVSAGAHETMFILARGERLARLLRLDKSLRINVFPLKLALPWGLLIGPGAILPYLPLPAKVTVEVGTPIQPPNENSAQSANEIYKKTQGAMQSILDRLYKERRWPVVG